MDLQIFVNLNHDLQGQFFGTHLFHFRNCWKNWFLFFLQQRFPKLWSMNRICFLNHDNCVKKEYENLDFAWNYQYRFHETGYVYLKHLYSKSLNVSVMNRDRPIFFREFFIRCHYEISQTSFMLVLYFVVILEAV